jgi:hypothetical protein
VVFFFSIHDSLIKDSCLDAISSALFTFVSYNRIGKVFCAIASLPVVTRSIGLSI